MWYIQQLSIILYKHFVFAIDQRYLTSGGNGQSLALALALAFSSSGDIF